MWLYNEYKKLPAGIVFDAHRTGVSRRVYHARHGDNVFFKDAGATKDEARRRTLEWINLQVRLNGSFPLSDKAPAPEPRYVITVTCPHCNGQHKVGQFNGYKIVKDHG